MNPTITGSKNITITLESGETEEIKVRQIPIREYEQGLKCFTDEISLVAFLVGKPKEFALMLSPESYEQALGIGKEVNARGFFSFCQRRMEAETQREMQVAAALASLPQEVVKTLTEQGAKLSSDSSSIPRPKRV